MFDMLVRLVLAVSVVALTRPHLNPKGPIHESYAVGCLVQIAKQQFKYINDDGMEQGGTLSVRLLTIMKTANLTSPTFEIQSSLLKQLHDVMTYSIEVIDTWRGGYHFDFPSHFYVIVVDTARTFDEKLKVLTRADNFNPKGLFLVYYSTVETAFKQRASTILDKLWRKSIDSAIVVVPRTLRHLTLFTMNFSLRRGKHCLDEAGATTVDHCIDGKINTSRNYYEMTGGRNFRNCTLDVVANQIEPFVINEHEGFEISLIKQLGEALNIFFNITLTGEDSWGVKDDNGSWTNGLKRVYEDSALGIGNFYNVPEYRKDFEVTVPHFQSDLVFIVPIAQYTSKWRVLTIIFSWQLWVLCVTLILVFAVVIRMTSRSKHEFNRYKRLDYDFFISYRVIITAVVAQHPKSDHTRIAFVSLSILSIVISAVYTSSLINYLTHPRREPQVNTLEGVLENNWDIGGLPVYANIFNESRDETSRRIHEIFQVNDSLNIWLTSVADDRDTCTITTDFFIKYNLANHNPILIDHHGVPKIYIFDRKVFSYSLVIVANAGFPFLKRINKALRLLRMFGIVNGMARKYMNVVDKIKTMGEEPAAGQPLSLHHLQGAFAIVILGSLLGTVSFVVEIVLGLVAKTNK